MASLWIGHSKPMVLWSRLTLIPVWRCRSPIIVLLSVRRFRLIVVIKKRIFSLKSSVFFSVSLAAVVKIERDRFPRRGSPSSGTRRS